MTTTSRPTIHNSRPPLAGVLSRPAVICWILAIVTFAVFLPAGNYDFINLDDPAYVSASPQVRAGLTPKGVVWAFTTNQADNWHPVTWLSLMLDTELFGDMFDNPAAWPHLMNVILHAANTVLLFLLLRKLTGAHWRSAFVAALFALHPLHVESVAWISERKDVLSTLFFLLTLMMYERYVSSAGGQVPGAAGPSPHALRRSSWSYGLSLFLFALGLMSKPMLVTLPFVLLLLDFWPLERLAKSGLEVPVMRRLVMEKLPFFALSAASCVVTFMVQQQSRAVRSLTDFSFGVRIENAFVSYARYLGKLFWPTDLVILYPHPGHWPLTLVILAALLVVGLSAAVLWRARTRPFLVTGWYWFLGTLVPVIGLIQVGRQSMADRYTYLPLIGVFIMLTWGIGALIARLRLPAVAVAVMAVLVLGASAAQTSKQVRYWRNSETVFRHALDRTEKNALAHDNLGIHLLTTGRPDEAMAEFRRALQINPDDADALNGLSAVLANRQEYAEANRCMQRLLQIHPKDAAAHFNYGAILVAQERWDEATAQFSEALRLKPDLATAKQGLDYVRSRTAK